MLYKSLLISDLNIPIGLLDLKLSHTVAMTILPRVKVKIVGLLSAKEKESYRWIEHFFREQNLAETIDNLEIVYVADREADNIALFQEFKHPRSYFVIRSNHNRRLKGKSIKLYH